MNFIKAVNKETKVVSFFPVVNYVEIIQYSESIEMLMFTNSHQPIPNTLSFKKYDVSFVNSMSSNEDTKQVFTIEDYLKIRGVVALLREDLKMGIYKHIDKQYILRQYDFYTDEILKILEKDSRFKTTEVALADGRVIRKIDL